MPSKFNILIVTNPKIWIFDRFLDVLREHFPQYSFSILRVLTEDANIKREYDCLYILPYDVALRLPEWIELGPSKPSIAWFSHIFAEQGEPSLDDMKNVAKQVNFGIALLHEFCEVLPCRMFQIDHPTSIINQYSTRLKLFFPGKLKKRKGESLIKQIKADKRFEVVISNGKFTQEEMVVQYKMCDWVIMPSLAEGGPLCLPESLLYNRPIAITPVGEWEKYRDINTVHIIPYENFVQFMIEQWKSFRQKQIQVEKMSERFLDVHRQIFEECERLIVK